MAKIDFSLFPDNDLVVFSVVGSPKVEDLVDSVRSFYDEHEVTLNVIWDVTEGSFGEMKAADLTVLTGFLKKGHGMRQGGKTALVSPSDLSYGIGRMFETYASLANLEVKYKSFRKLDDAFSWIHSS